MASHFRIKTNFRKCIIHFVLCHYNNASLDTVFLCGIYQHILRYCKKHKRNQYPKDCNGRHKYIKVCYPSKQKTICITFCTTSAERRRSNIVQMLCYLCLLGTQYTQNICITFIQRRPNVFDAGPTLYKCYTNILCLLGICYCILHY